jgi:hypothetical protein
VDGKYRYVLRTINVQRSNAWRQGGRACPTHW